MICEHFDLPPGAEQALKLLPPHEHLLVKDGCVLAVLDDGRRALIGTFHDQAEFNLDAELPDGEWNVDFFNAGDTLIAIASPF